MQKIAFIGAESTGKTTLAKATAQTLQGIYVPEYVRIWVDEQNRLPEVADIQAIVEGQIALEEQLAQQNTPYLICDTTPLVNYVLIKHYLGNPPLWIEQEARYRKYDFLFLTLPDFPWVADGMQRESPEVQAKLHQDFVETLSAFGVPHHVLSGSIEERLLTVYRTIGRTI